MVTKGETWGGINLEFEIKIYTLLYVKQINNKGLLYSTGDYTQYLMLTYNKKETEKNIYIYGFPGGAVVKNLPANAGGARDVGCGFDPWVRKIPCSSKRQSTPVFLP